MDTPSISKADAIAAYGGNAAALARALNITPSAIYQWPEGPIAEGYALKLRYVLKPDVFDPSARLAAAADHLVHTAIEERLKAGRGEEEDPGPHQVEAASAGNAAAVPAPAVPVDERRVA